MESVDRSDLTVIPPDKVLYNEVLWHKVNSKLKKLQVKLQQSAASDGSKVFSLDIKGVNHNCQVHFDFCQQELCFLHLEELQENVHTSSCFPCLDRNFYPSIVYSRLMLLWYNTEESVGGEAKCIKVPFLQCGNVNATTSLRKLQSVIYRHITDEESLQHWHVHVVQCGMMEEGERVYLGVTKYAMVVVLHYHILHHHAFYSSEFTVSCDPDRQQIDITVTDKTWGNTNQETENFALSTTNTYVFKSAQCELIEKRLKSVQRQSHLRPHGPSAHFNIWHREQSATGFIPGTTSDNVMIIPHYPFPVDNNNTGSSGSNGHIPNLPKTLNTEISVHPDPQRHYPAHLSSSSNGYIPGSGSSSFPAEIKEMMTKRGPAEIPGSHPDRPDTLSIAYTPRGHYSVNSGAQEAMTGSKPKAREDSVKRSNIGSPREVCKQQQMGNSFPLVIESPHRHRSTPSVDGLPRRLSMENFDNDGDDDIFSIFPGDKDDELVDDLPPPAPCNKQSHRFGEFRYKPPVALPTEDEETSPKDQFESTFDQKLPRKSLRSQSFCELSDNDTASHFYVNVAQEMFLRRNVHDDSPYYRFYYNFGLVRMATMSKKIKRRDRLSQEMKTVELDYNKLETHEQWFDTCYKYRDKDLKFCRLNRMNIEVEEPNVGYAKPLEHTSDDPYWNSDLCVTLQAMLQENPQHSQLTDDITNNFDMSSEQSIGVQILLSLVPSEKNWRDLAEYIGLDSSDISVIEHFSYTYRELTTKVVLAHWIKLYNDGKTTKICDNDSLREFVEEIDRNDIMNILQSPPTNAVVTHF